MSQKRNRSINWNEEEKQLFRTVLKDYTHIIESKCLDTNTNKNKSKAWEEFHKKFNELNSRPRELSQLKIQWKTMKIHARKVCSTFKKEVNKTGGGARPTTPDNSFIEIKDLLNPAELLRDHNVYDSDGIIINEINNISNQQLANMFTEAIEDVDTQVDFEKTPLVVSQDNKSAATPMEKYVNSLPIMISEDDTTVETPKNVPKRKIILNDVVGNGSNLRRMSEDDTMTTPKTKSISINPAKNVPKRKTILNNVVGNGSKLRKDQEEYVSRMLSHSKLLKDEEHMRRMEMADEEHKIKIEIHKEKLNAAILEREIHKEKLKAAILEREILELKKGCEASKIN